VSEPPSGRFGGWSRRRIVFLSISAAVVVALIVWAAEVLLPFVIALIVAFVLTPLVARCERLRMPRAVAILFVYAVTGGVLYVGAATILPRVYVEGTKLMRDAPELGRDLAAQWAPRLQDWVDGVFHRARRERKPVPDTAPAPAIEMRQGPDGALQIEIGAGIDVIQHGPGHWRVGPATERAPARIDVKALANQGIEEFLGYAKRNAFELIRYGQALIKGVARGVFLLFMTLMVAGYLMHTRESIVDFFRSLVPPRARIGFDRLIFRIDRGLSGVVRGQLLICLVNGVLSAIGFWMFDLKYWPILAIVAAVMSIVPIFGSILSSIPAVMIGLTQGFWIALWVLLWIIGIHQIEANLLNPKIIGVAAKIHPVLVVMSLLIGEHFFGIWGALLAVPALSLMQSVFQHFRFEAMPDAPPDSLLPPTGGGRSIASSAG
jgi:predicted PurR-regulated permease PerM